MTDGLWKSGTKKLLSDLQGGAISSADLQKHCLEQSRLVQDQTQAFYEVFDLEGSPGASSSSCAAPLMGAPVAVKDFIFIKDKECSAGSAMLEKFVAPYNATCVARLLKGGASLVGRTSMDEFGMGSSNENSVRGPVRNPWDLTKAPGGSSGGSAAAVASGAVPFALGTDTGGSVRQPASFCGITGFKPSYGRVSRFGVISFASSLDQVGTFAMDAYGCARLLENISGEDHRDPTTSRIPPFAFHESEKEFWRGKKVAVPDFLVGAEMDAPVKAAFEDFQNWLCSNGAVVSSVSMPLLEYSLAVYYLICTSEASSNLSRYDGVHLGFGGEKNISLNRVIQSARSQGFGDEVKRRILLGTFALSAGYRDAFFNKAAKVRRLLKESYEATFESYDFVLTPTSLETAFALGDRAKDPIKMYNSDICTIGPSLAGLPAISFPVKTTGMPVGMQLVAPYMEDLKLLQAVENFQEASDGYRPKLAPLASESAAEVKHG